MSNRVRNSKKTIIPTSALPKGSYRTRLEDGTRVWVINGMNFESKAAYVQYLRDKALMEKIAASQKAAPATDATAGSDDVSVASVFDQQPVEEGSIPAAE